MAMSRTSSTTSSATLAESTSSTDSAGTTTASLLAVDETMVAVSITESEPSASDLMQMVIGGDATAVGENTIAVGSVSAEVSDNEITTTASGTATFSAVAQSEGEETSYATSYSFAEVLGGEKTIAMNHTSTQVYEAKSESTWSQTSTAQVFAIDIDSPGTSSDDLHDVPTGPAAERDEPSEYDAEAVEFEVEPSNEVDESVMIDGNFAFFDVEAEATGEDTFLSLDAMAIVIEDQLSTVSVVVVAETG